MRKCLSSSIKRACVMRYLGITSLLFFSAVTLYASNLSYQLTSLEVSLHTLQKQLGKSATPAYQSMPISTIWKKIAQGGTYPDKDTKIKMFEDDCKQYKEENAKIPAKMPDIVRIMTYNVKNFSKKIEIKNILKTLNPDVIIFQEITWDGYANTQSEWEKELGKLGYAHSSFCLGLVMDKTKLGNAIFSKFEFDPIEVTFKQPEAPKERRCLIYGFIEPLPGKKISLYGTHLDVWDKTENTRLSEIKEILDEIKDDKNNNIVIAADFNSVRKQDYQYKIDNKLAWDLLVQDNQRRGEQTFTKVFDELAAHNFKDCFSVAKIPGPKFTVWSGTVIDFIMLSKNWNLPITGCYVYFDAASDHLPVIMDIKISSLEGID